MIVVVDTNVWISALQFGTANSTPALALQKAEAEDTIATCDEITEEIVRTLREKFHWRRQTAYSVIERRLKYGVKVRLTGTVHVCRDPNDDMILECAQLADADVIIAGDKDLLVLRRFGRTRIVTPVEYLAFPR